MLNLNHEKVAQKWKAISVIFKITALSKQSPIAGHPAPAPINT
jgi:hypothetical protein